MADVTGDAAEVPVEDGFALVLLKTAEGRGFSGRQWARLIHQPCGARAALVEPTTERLSTYRELHDCNARHWTMR